MERRSRPGVTDPEAHQHHAHAGPEPVRLDGAAKRHRDRRDDNIAAIQIDKKFRARNGELAPVDSGFGLDVVRLETWMAARQFEIVEHGFRQMIGDGRNPGAHLGAGTPWHCRPILARRTLARV
jgi:hypothetical protein